MSQSLTRETPMRIDYRTPLPFALGCFGIGRSISISNDGSMKWPTHIFIKWPFCMGDLKNTLRR